MTKLLRALLVVLAFVSAPAIVGGCASERREVVRPMEPRAPAQTRPAVPIDEERPWYEKSGEVAVIIVGAILIIGGIVLPIILFAN